MARALGNLDVRKHVIVVCDHKNAKNEWKDDKEIVFQSPSAKKDAKERIYYQEKSCRLIERQE